MWRFFLQKAHRMGATASSEIILGFKSPGTFSEYGGQVIDPKLFKSMPALNHRVKRANQKVSLVITRGDVALSSSIAVDIK